jgi:hypothetical protein
MVLTIFTEDLVVEAVDKYNSLLADRCMFLDAVRRRKCMQRKIECKKAVVEKLEIRLDIALKELDKIEGEIYPLPQEVTENQLMAAKEAIYEAIAEAEKHKNLKEGGREDG